MIRVKTQNIQQFQDKHQYCNIHVTENSEEVEGVVKIIAKNYAKLMTDTKQVQEPQRIPRRINTKTNRYTYV